MSKPAAYALAALFASVSPHALAQTAPSPSTQAMQSEARDLTEVRIDVVKNALQLSSDQMKYWPAIEEAIRARAEMRRQRFESFATRMDEPRSDFDFVKVMQKHAEVLSERGASLRRLADAWQPLYPTLSDTQKRRMRVLAFVVLQGVGEDFGPRRERMEPEDPSGASIGAGSGEGGLGR